MTNDKPEISYNKDGSTYHLNLKPNQIATEKIMVVGDPGFVHLVSQYFDKVTFEMNKREFNTHTGMLVGKKVTVMSTGIGSDNIEIFYNELDALVNFDFKKKRYKNKLQKLEVVRIGTSSSLQQDIEPGTKLISNHSIGFDNVFQFYQLPQSEFEKEIGVQIKEQLQLNFTPYCVKGSDQLKSRFTEGMIDGNTVTVPGFYGPQGRKGRIAHNYPKMIDHLSYLHYHDFWLTDIDMETSSHFAMARLLNHEVTSINLVTGQRFADNIIKNQTKALEELIQQILELW